VPKSTKPGKKSAKTTSKKLNHKSPAAAQKRAENDEKIRSILQRPEAKEGLKRERIAELAELSPTDVKACLNRLAKAKQVTSAGRTIDTKYFLAKGSKKGAPAKTTATFRPGVKKGADEES
jgi:hypothetical protein